MYGSSLACIVDFVVSCIKSRISNVVDDRVVEENGILWHYANVRTQAVEVYVPNILAVDSNASFSNVVEAIKQFQYGTLSGAGLADKAAAMISILTFKLFAYTSDIENTVGHLRNRLSWNHREGDIFQNLLLLFVGKSDILEIDLSCFEVEVWGVRLANDFRLCLHDLEQTLSVN